MSYKLLSEAGYNVQDEIKCCQTCKYRDSIDDEGFELCSNFKVEVEPLGICDLWEAE